MLGLAFVSVRLGVTYGLAPVMKTTPSFMTVPNLFCQCAARGEALQVLEDRPMAFIHVQDAAAALLHVASAPLGDWQVVNAAPEVATIGEVARTVQRLGGARGLSVQIEGDTGSQASFAVRSRMAREPRWRLQTGLAEVLDHFGGAR
jgi:nucleoside-diphosphate-sugar epimerase